MSARKMQQLEERIEMLENRRSVEKNLVDQRREFDFQKQLALATVKKDQEAKLQQLAIQSTRGVKAEFLKILRIAHDTGDHFRYIQSYCLHKMTDIGEDDVKSRVAEIEVFKSDLKEESYRLQLHLLHEKIVHKPTHNLLKDYLQKFETIMDQQRFVDMCTQLPAAIDNREWRAIGMFGKQAGTLADDLKKNRDDFAMLLNRIPEDSSQLSICG